MALIAGPTASGKSDLAVALALALNERGQSAAVINADSAQVYRDLAVLSARPTPQDMRGVQHLLFGAWDGADACSAADWAAAASTEIERLHVPLAAVWVYDYHRQKDLTVTSVNARGYQLRAIRAANERICGRRR